MEITTVRQWGYECARYRLGASSLRPFDGHGRCLLPSRPSDKDWDWLTTLLGREPDDDERNAFAGAFSAIAQAEIERLTVLYNAVKKLSEEGFR